MEIYKCELCGATDEATDTDKDEVNSVEYVCLCEDCFKKMYSDTGLKFKIEK